MFETTEAVSDWMSSNRLWVDLTETQLISLSSHNILALLALLILILYAIHM